MAHCNISNEHLEYVKKFRCVDCKHCYHTRSKKRCEGYKCGIDKVIVCASGDACILFEKSGTDEKI